MEAACKGWPVPNGTPDPACGERPERATRPSTPIPLFPPSSPPLLLPPLLFFPFPFLTFSSPALLTPPRQKRSAPTSTDPKLKIAYQKMNDRIYTATGFARPAIIVTRRKGGHQGEVVGQTGLSASLVTSVAATSAYLAPLIVPRVYKELRREMPWLWCLPRPHRSLSPHVGAKGFTDGCAWDTRALGSALYALKKLPLPSPIVLVVAPEPFDVRAWWRSPHHAYAYASTERLYFDETGARPMVLYDAAGCTMQLVPKCRVRVDVEDASWTPPGAHVDLVVLTLDGRHLNTVVFHKTHSHAEFERKAARHFGRALDHLDRERPVILALSGGGTRAAIVAHTSLRLLVRRRMPPHAITACSGGAWGVVLYAQVGDRLGFAHLVRNGKLIEASSAAQTVGIMVAHDLFGRRVDMIIHIIRALINVHFEWKALVHKMLFGDGPAMTWDALLANLPSITSFVGFSTGIIG